MRWPEPQIVSLHEIVAVAVDRMIEDVRDPELLDPHFVGDPIRHIVLEAIDRRNLPHHVMEFGLGSAG